MGIKTIDIGDVPMDKKAVIAHRETIIGLRDAALEGSRFDWSVVLSYNVALLQALIDNMEDEE